LGRRLLRGARGPDRSADLKRAAAAFDEAVRLEPKGVWPTFYQGVCAFELKRYEDAVLAFTACIALASPNERPGCLYNRARTYEAGGRIERAPAGPGRGRMQRALADYTRALELDPTLAPAALNRGLLRYHAKRYPEALRDIENALRHGASPAVVHYDMAL